MKHVQVITLMNRNVLRLTIIKVFLLQKFALTNGMHI